MDDKPENPRDEARRLRLARDEWRTRFESREEIFSTRMRFHWAVAGIVVILAMVGSFYAGSRTQKPSPARQITVDAAVPVAERYTPNHILAAIQYGGCSGEVWSKDKERAAVMSAKHCVVDDRGNWTKGAKYSAGNVLGQTFEMTLEDVHQTRDLACFSMPSKFVVAVANIAEELPDYSTEKEAVGFPQRRGPNFKRLAREIVNHKCDDGTTFWKCAVQDGTFWEGDSGGGVYLVGCSDDPKQDGLLAGVISASVAWRDANGGIHAINDGTQQHPHAKGMFAVQHAYLLEFAQKQMRSKGWNCGNGICKIRKKGAQQTAPGKPDWLMPNVPIKVPPPADDETLAPAPAPEAQSLNQPPYDGHGRPPVGIRTPHQRSAWIDLLRRKNASELTDIEHLHVLLDDLQKQVAGHSQPAPLPGPPGKDGRDGKDGAQGVPGVGGGDVSAIQSQVDAINKKLASLPSTDLSSINAQLADIVPKVTLLMQGLTVQVLDGTGAVIDQDSYPPGKPIKLQNATRSIPITQKAKTNGG